MRKLTLNLEELDVESFHVASDTEHRPGTVKGAGNGVPWTVELGDTDTGNIGCMSWFPCSLESYPSVGDYTCQASCNGTCGESSCIPLENTCV
jgi:hypothetical protein